ncbi:hypothetical protein, partial [Vibrio sp. 10N.222.49.C9]|uniref:hypothetical protein n=1 Tax=Vibrio sp. 10N.222.49.C9 TaxID=3229615 RepID=UPI00354DCAD2
TSSAAINSHWLDVSWNLFGTLNGPLIVFVMINHSVMQHESLEIKKEPAGSLFTMYSGLLSS